MQRLIDDILEETNHPANPYLIGLADGSFAKDDFVETQIQFFYAVTFFNRPMAAVAAKIPSTRLRKAILRNVWEEHGEGEEDEEHESTFLSFLERLNGVSKEEVLHRQLWPELRMFNTTLTGACVVDEYLVSVGVLGMIERMFADISARIGNSGLIVAGSPGSDSSTTRFMPSSIFNTPTTSLRYSGPSGTKRRPIGTILSKGCVLGLTVLTNFIVACGIPVNAVGCVPILFPMSAASRSFVVEPHCPRVDSFRTSRLPGAGRRPGEGRLLSPGR